MYNLLFRHKIELKFNSDTKYPDRNAKIYIKFSLVLN